MPRESSMATHSFRFDLSSFSFVAAIAVITSILFCVHPAGAADANAAQVFVQQNVDRANAILDNPSVSAEQRRMESGQLMLSMTDTRRIGLFALGRYANGATPEELSAFQNAFKDYATAAYESQFDKFKGGRITVTGAAMRAPNDFVVNAEMIRPSETENREPLKLAFRVRTLPDGSFVLIDMQFEGIWLALSEREDFTAFLQQHGGDMSALTDSLRAKTQETLAGAARGSRPAG
jgi:phospholipid transport system substrate-binding protein